MAANDVSVQKIAEWREMTNNDFNAPPPPGRSFFRVKSFESTGEALRLLEMRRHDANALLFYNAHDRAVRKHKAARPPPPPQISTSIGAYSCCYVPTKSSSYSAV